MTLNAMIGVARMHGVNAQDIARHLGITKASFYARFRQETWTVKDVLKVCQFLGATEEQRNAIFFD